MQHVQTCRTIFYQIFLLREKAQGTICLFLDVWILVISAVLGVVQCCILRVMCVACVNCKQPGGSGPVETGDTGERPLARANTSTAYFISTAVLLLLVAEGGGWTEQCQSDCGDSRVLESLSNYWRALT